MQIENKSVHEDNLQVLLWHSARSA